MRLLVCGARKIPLARDRTPQLISRALAELRAMLREPISCLMQGGASGVDTYARRYAANHEITHLAFPADWATHGNAAGPRRNQRMIDEGNPDLVLAIPGPSSVGTWDMIRRATECERYVIIAPQLIRGANKT